MKKKIKKIHFINKKEFFEFRKKMLSKSDYFEMSLVFKILGDQSRLKIVSALMEAKRPVHDIAEIIGSTPSAVSHQLRIMRQLSLVKYEKEGQIIYYSLGDKHIEELFKLCLEHIRDLKQKI